ncbi:MAG: hypothetical protein KME16_06805 [Scytolyngbya sp. HA4215-MV1]|jgi:hypothetical protein|nr:hypothetical protein [Scytolyngbya sp. HA4215-MV1]
MKRAIPFFLSVALVSSTVACQKAPEQANTTPDSSTNTASKTSTKNTASTKQTEVAAGTTFDTDLQQAISTGKNHNQDRFTLRVKGSLLGGNPVLKNAEIQGHLEDVVKAARGKKASLHLVFDDIKLSNGDLYPIDVTLINTQVESKTKGKFLKNAGIVLAGAAAGHFLGNKAKFKHGGLAGGAAAAAFVLSSPGGEVELQKGTDVKLKLKSVLNLSS